MAALKYKDDHNKIAYLGRERGCEDFTYILSYLDHSPLKYALTHAPPVVFDSLVKQFWATTVVRPNAARSHDLVATIDGREVVVTESLIRAQLQLDDANGIFDMPINNILEGMRVIGYSTDGTVTFLKNYLSPQWRFLVHTLMHCLRYRRRKYFTYLKELLPHVYREDLLLLRRRMNRYFRLNPEVDIGLELWRDVNMLCQSLHSDDVEDFWRTQDEWIVCGWKLYPKSSVHVLDLTNGKTVLTVPPSYCRDVVVAGNIIQTVQAGLRQAYECIASAPIACTARQMVFSSPWLTAKKESGSPLQTALVCNSNPLMVASSCVYLMLLFWDIASTVSAACIVAAGYIVSAGICDAAGSFVLAVFIYICCLLCFCCYSILLLREDLSRNLELTESKPSLGEDCWELLKMTKCRFCC
ncbi:hypothetical protein Tco_0193659 [Tanacetum coccineum]